MNTDIPLQIDVSQPFPSTNINKSSKDPVGSRRRSNSQSQVVAMPTAASTLSRQRGLDHLIKRNQVQYYVTLTPLNDTFTKKHLPVATYPDTTKLGRPTGTKHKPDVTNGYFDSRVLSRNHAQIYIDPKTGKLMLQDLGSSNGTYLNDVRLTRDPVEISIGDNVCLGFNVQVESTHKQISLRIDNINIIGNTGQSAKNEPSIFGNRTKDLDPVEFKHLSFMEDIYKLVTSKDPKSQEVSFENALYGDINPSLEDNLLGLYSSANSGIYNNSQLTNPSALESVINTLVLNLSKLKQQNNYLNTLEVFFDNYNSRVNELNGAFLETEFKRTLSDLQSDLKKQRTSNQKLKDRIKLTESEATDRTESLAKKLILSEKEKELLKKKLNDLQQQLEESKEKEAQQREELHNQDLNGVAKHLDARSSSDSLVDVLGLFDTSAPSNGKLHGKEKPIELTPPGSDDESEVNVTRPVGSRPRKEPLPFNEEDFPLKVEHVSTREDFPLKEEKVKEAPVLKDQQVQKIKELGASQDDKESTPKQEVPEQEEEEETTPEFNGKQEEKKKVTAHEIKENSKKSLKNKRPAPDSSLVEHELPEPTVTAESDVANDKALEIPVLAAKQASKRQPVQLGLYVALTIVLLGYLLKRQTS